MDKLFGKRDYVPSNAIGILNVRNRDRIDELVKLIKAICKIENALLVFKKCSTGKRQPYFDEVHAYLFNKNKIAAAKQAYLSDIAVTPYMHFENERL